MKFKAATVEEYLQEVPTERQPYFNQLRNVILENLPAGFVEQMSYGMIGYLVPHDIYPDGYHCNPELPLPFVNIASQKNFVGLYHMGIYSSPDLLGWFLKEYPKHCKLKLDMGKSCIRFKKAEQIPLDLIAELMQKMSVDDWIHIYETAIKR